MEPGTCFPGHTPAYSTLLPWTFTQTLPCLDPLELWTFYFYKRPLPRACLSLHLDFCFGAFSHPAVYRTRYLHLPLKKRSCLRSGLPGVDVPHLPRAALRDSTTNYPKTDPSLPVGSLQAQASTRYTCHYGPFDSTTTQNLEQTNYGAPFHWRSTS